jgi:hypothetical protein
MQTTTNQIGMAQCPCGMSGPFSNQSTPGSRSRCGIVTSKDNASIQHWATWTWDDSDADPINWAMSGKCFGSTMDDANMTGWRDAAQPFHMSPHKPKTAWADDGSFCGIARSDSMRKTTSFFRGWTSTVCPGCSAGMDFFS